VWENPTHGIPVFNPILCCFLLGSFRFLGLVQIAGIK
jgi:hypothetical protein